MLPYNRSKVVGVNPFLVKNGHGSGIFYGLNVTGIQEPAQATRGSTSGSQDLPLGPDAPATNIFRWKPCIALVADWPWAEDDIGTPFAQSSLLAVRTRCCVAGVEGEGGDGGEVDWWTAVPKVLPDGFTFKGRSAIWGGIETDFLGDFPAYGPVSWDPFGGVGEGGYIRNAIRWREPREIDGFGALCTHTDYQWAPCNLSRVSLSFGSQVGWYATGGAPGDESYLIDTLGEIMNGEPLKHLGFRGGRMGVTLPASGPYAPSGTLTVMIGYSATATPSSMSDVTVTWSSDITTAATGDVLVGECLAPTSGGPNARKYWHFITRVIVGAVGERAAITTPPGVSPRTDIPLHFTAITGNRVAPGGIIALP